MQNDRFGIRREARWTSGVALLGLLLGACGADAASDTPGSGGSAGTSTSTAAGSSALAGGAAGGGSVIAGGAAGATPLGAETRDCESSAPAPRALAGRLELPIEVTVGSTPAVLGTAAAEPGGREFQLSLLKLFITQPVFVDPAGNEAPGQIVGGDGKPLPYGIQLIDLGDPATQVWRIAATEGSYTKLKFGVGIPPGCNSPTNTNLVYPLNPDSEMFWTWGSQFLFIRVEGSTRATAAEELAPFLYHVGFDPAFAHITVEGALTVMGTSQGPTLALDVARMLATDGKLPEPQHNVPDGWVSDNLERNGAFSLK